MRVVGTGDKWQDANWAEPRDRKGALICICCEDERRIGAGDRGKFRSEYQDGGSDLSQAGRTLRPDPAERSG